MPDTAAGFRLSPSQRRWWHLGATDAPFRVQCALSLSADLDIEGLRQALESAIAREAIFRTRFLQVPGLTTPIQVVDEQGSLFWREVDVDDLSADLPRLLEREREAPVDLEHGPTVRALCARHPSGERVLILSVPSVCADVATLRMLADDMADHERAAGVPFVQFAEWQNQCAESGARVEAVVRWIALQAAAPEAIGLAVERRVPTGGFAPQFQSTPMEAAVVQRLHATAERLGVRSEALVLACWQLLLRVLTGREGLVVGVLAPGRDHASVAGVCGPVSKAIPQRIDAVLDGPFSETARRVDADLREQQQWGPYYSAGDAEMLLPFTFSWEAWPARFRVGDGSLSLLGRYACIERFVLHLTCAWVDGRLTLDLGYDSARVPSEAAADIARLVQTLLMSAIEQPDSPANHLHLLDPGSRSRVLALSVGPTSLLSSESLTHLFERQVASTPDRVAVVDTRRQLTYRELDAASDAVAQALRGLGAGPDMLIGLAVDRSADALVGLIAILKAGAAYVPLDAGQPAERWLGAAGSAGLHALVMQSSLEPPSGLGVPVVRLPLGADPETATSRAGTTPVSGGNLAYAIFTSGSTGQPKAVAIEHRAVLNLLAALDRLVYQPFGAPSRVALNAPLTFDASVKQWIQVLHGHTVCLVPEEVRYDPSAMLAWLRQERVDVVDCTPAQIQPLIAAGLSDASVPDLKAVLVGGDAIDSALWTSLADLSRICFYNVYGPTECTVDTTACLVRAELDVPVIGRPLDNIQSYVLDRRLEPVPVGVEGELFIGGAGVARGYANAPGSTAQRFLPDPFGTVAGSRLYRTGDRVRWLGNGQIEFLGRLDRQIKIRGYRVEPGEIEAVLAEHPGVQAAVATIETGLEGHKRLVAYIVASSRVTLEESDLRAVLRGKLPEFMLPDRIARVDSLPLTSHGKVDYRALSERARPLERRELPAPPRNELERTIAEVWCHVLEIDSVGIDDNLFDRGGHSLLLAQLYARLRETLGRDFTMMELFRRPTISSFASFLTESTDQAWSRASVLERAARQKQAHRRQQVARSKEP